MKPVILFLVLAAAFWLRATDAPVAAALRETVREVVGQNQDARAVVQVFGLAAAGEQDNALLVFGRELLDSGRIMGQEMLT